MRPLFDENLSRQLVSRLEDLYPGSMHVAAARLLESPDVAIGDYAKARHQKSIWLREWTHPTKDAERVLRNEAIRIAEFGRDPELGLLILEKD